jgi:hypothetical protein
VLVIVPRRLRAPEVNGAILAEPPFDRIGDLIQANRNFFSRLERPIFNRPWSTLQRQARRTIISLAKTYLQSAGEPVPDFGDASLLMAGHQPELVHPGVWIKHFALNGLAQRYGSTPVNLVVDNDTVKSCAIGVPVLPSMTDGRPHVQSVPFDEWTGEMPFEERAVKNESMFRAFPAEVARYSGHWNFRPLVSDFWHDVTGGIVKPAPNAENRVPSTLGRDSQTSANDQPTREMLLGERLASGRRAIERRWGCHNLEIPVSELCDSEPFAWFVVHMLLDIRRFHGIYNACVHEYRRQYGIRSRNHPVPDLAAEGDWYELPLWSWRCGQLERHRLMAKATGQAIQLRSGDETWPSLPLLSESDADSMVKAYLQLRQSGFKIRSRALSNTLFARLILADLFIHGIGGAKYDELTDEIIRRFYRIEPPAYMVLSATLRLPLPNSPATVEECRRYRADLRDLHYNPQRHLSPKALSDETSRGLVEKKKLLADHRPGNSVERKEWFTALRALSAKLEPYVGGTVEEVRGQLRQCEREVETNAVIQRRDYAFCLFPEEKLRSFCTQFLYSN